MAVFSLALFLEMTAWGHLLAFTPLYLAQELNLSQDVVPFWTGILASSSLAVAFPLSPFWGVLADRYSRRAVMMRSQIAEAIAYTALALIGNVWQMLAVRLLLGFSFGNVAVMIATQSLVTPDRRLGFAIGTIQMAHPLAISVGPLFGSLLINTIGIRGMFAVDAVLALSASALIFFLVREPPRRDTTTSVGKRLKIALGQVATVPPVRWNFVCWFLVYVAISASDPYVPIVIARQSGSLDPATTIGLILAIQGVLTGLGTPLAGRFADRVGAARLFLVAAGLAVFISLGISAATTLTMLGVLIVMRAIPMAATAPALYTHLAGRTPPEHRAAVLALTPMPRNLAMFIGPAAGASVTQLGLVAVFWLTAALYAVALPFAVLLGRKPAPRAGSAQEEGPPPA